MPPSGTEYWNTIAADFDAIYSGQERRGRAALDQWFRKDIYSDSTG